MAPEERLCAADGDFFGDFCPLVVPASRLEHKRITRFWRQCTPHTLFRVVPVPH